MKELIVHGASGAVSAGISNAVVYPLEVLRVRICADKGNFGPKELLEMLKKQGIKSLYSGFWSGFISQSTSYAVYFFVYRYTQKSLNPTQINKILKDLVTSLIASFVTLLVNCPIWTINSRLIMDNRLGVVGCFKKILKEEGFTGLYKGFSSSVILLSNPVIQFAGYELLKRKLGDTNNALKYVVMASISKLVATVTTYPLQTIRTRTQLEASKQLSILEVIKDMVQNEGVLSLYKGQSSKLMQTLTNAALIMSIHEKLTRLMKDVILQ